jgi:hypothetical protein
MADAAFAVVVVVVAAADIGGEINSPSSNRDSVSWSNQCFSCCVVSAAAVG